jgi:undecaprenyl-phosphate 4-deoxy-4-formamido-L-arabinose transferase
MKTIELDLSVVFPVHNDETELPAMLSKLFKSLDELGVSYEVVFVDDGSKDRSTAILQEQFEKRPDVTRVILFNTSYGEDNAIMAGLLRSRGARIVTLDTDPLNPPDQISKLLEAMDRGHDYVGGVRAGRPKTWFRRTASRLMKKVRARTANVFITDRDCTLRAYDRKIVDTINQCKEVSTFVPALAYTFSNNPTEVEITAQQAGRKDYSVFRLIRLNLDLLTGFSIAPLQLFSLAGFFIALLAILTLAWHGIHRIFYGPQAASESYVTIVDVFLLGLIVFGIGILGEYIGRINEQVQRRPRYLVSEVWERKSESES